MSWLSNWIGDITGANALKQASAQAAIDQERILAEQKALAQSAADEQERRRAETAANIETGRSSIDNVFSQFGEPYYGNISKSYVDFYKPQLEDQYARALDTMTARLAGQGMLESSVGASKLADLAKTRADKSAAIAHEGEGFANNIRGTVNQTRDRLYNDNNAAADPSMAASKAQGEATTLVRAGSTSPVQPLGDVFSGLIPFVSNTLTAYANRGRNVNSYTPTSGNGSSSVYG